RTSRTHRLIHEFFDNREGCQIWFYNVLQEFLTQGIYDLGMSLVQCFKHYLRRFLSAHSRLQGRFDHREIWLQLIQMLTNTLLEEAPIRKLILIKNPEHMFEPGLVNTLYHPLEELLFVH